MLIQTDFNIEDVKDGFDALPVGSYPGKIVKAELVTASTGKPMVKVEWEITEGEFQGRKVWDNIVLTVAFKVKQYAGLIGVTSGNSFDTNDLIGIEAALSLIQEPNQNNDGFVNKIKKIEKM